MHCLFLGSLAFAGASGAVAQLATSLAFVGSLLLTGATAESAADGVGSLLLMGATAVSAADFVGSLSLMGATAVSAADFVGSLSLM
eukprot:COSAG02_NODE_15871_length_1134_cov_3.948792_1_plen_85_part_10